MNKFRNASGARLLGALFLEVSNSDKSLPVYTLKDADHNGLPSLRRLYIEAEDMEEHDFAASHLDGWDHWQMLLACSWFQPYVYKWRQELAAKIASRHTATIERIASGSGKEALTAAKYLLERAEKVTGTSRRGRPRKGSDPIEISHQQASEAENVSLDLKRLGIN